MSEYTITTNADGDNYYELPGPMTVPGHANSSTSWVPQQTIGAFPDTTFITTNWIWFAVAAAGALILLFALTRESD